MSSRVRASKIEIDIPTPDSIPVIRIRVQKVVYDENGKVVQTVPRVTEIYKPLTTVAMDNISYKSPVSNEVNEVFMAELAEAVKAATAVYISEKYGIEPDENNMIWVD